MKKSIIVFLITILSTLVFAEQQQSVISQIKDVTVYLKGAEVSSFAKVSVKPGITELVFENLATAIDANSIQVAGSGGVIVQAATFRTNYIIDKIAAPQIKLLSDSLENLEIVLESVRSKKFAYEEEQKMIIENRKLTGSDASLSVIELQKAADFFRSRLEQTNAAIYKFNRQEKDLNENVGRIKRQLSELNAKHKQPSGEIVVTVSSSQNTSANLELSYYVHNAGWAPIYDLRVKDINSKANLSCKANVWQNTGADWKNINLSLSTGNPSVGGTAPTMHPWYVYFYEPTYRTMKSSYGKGTSAPAAMSESMSLEYDKQELETTANYTQVVEQQLTTKFDIKVPYSILSDNKQHLVDIQEYDMPANYSHVAIPKLDADAFLLARVAGWEKYPLLPGQVNIFFENAYVGKSYLNPYHTDDTLEFSMGRDKNVIIKREMIKDFQEKKVLGTKTQESFGYEITVRNTKNAKINIRIEDQMPLSKNEQIKVELKESSGAKVETTSGKLIWNLEVAPSSNKTLKLIYSVEYPKDKQVNL